MAHTEDPPYLTVGTEVSAKYRGAFCEATIKTAKKLVKCKVSYGKGQSAVVTSDQIKGQLKIGGQVEVKQPDGQFQQANVVKLTDQSTYTVVFDDGDERTLKRSSLCLKGGRHFHESESLDHLPLTDPENFGTPVLPSTKRKRRRGSQSPSSSGTPSKKSCSYPTEFPVGKAVFLENDRRRSSWLPAVIVPAHYVLEASDMTPDTICLRSFKDGRYFAATKNELHEFSPSKEPLLSMLEGEIQAMYMCKPAIERAMAYIDTGELPWDMELFDHSSEHPNGPSTTEPATSDDDSPLDATLVAEAKEFEHQLGQFHETRGTSVPRQPMAGPHQLNLFQLYRLVKTNGGMDRVTTEMKWRSLYLQLGLPSIGSPSQALRQAYRKYLYQFELYEKNKAKGGAKEGWTRRSKPLPPGSDEEQESQTVPQNQANQQDRVKVAQQDRVKRQDRVRGQEKVRASGGGGAGEGKQRVGPAAGVKEEGEAKVNGVEKEKGRRLFLGEAKTIKMVKVDKLPRSFALTAPIKQEQSLEDSEAEDNNRASDAKSEGSDLESTPVAPGMGDRTWSREDMSVDLDCSTSLSASHLETEGVMRNLEQCSGGYKENDRILVLYGKGKTLRTYEAKVISVERGESKCEYLVHYSGWNNRYDEWIESSRIAGKLTEFTKRPHFSSKTKKTHPPPRSASTTTLIKPTTLPPGLLSPSLHAIITNNTSQPKPIKREKGQESISGKTISKCSAAAASSSKTSLSLVSSRLPSGPAEASPRPLRGSTRGTAGKGRGVRPERCRNKGQQQEEGQGEGEDQTSTISDSSTTPTATTTVVSRQHTSTSSSTPSPSQVCSAPPPSSAPSSMPSLLPPIPSSSSSSSSSSSDDSSSNSGASEDDQPLTTKHPIWSPPQATPLTSSSPSTRQQNADTARNMQSTATPPPPPPQPPSVCSESLPGLVLKTLTTSATLPPCYTSALSLLTEPAAHSLLSLSASAPALAPRPPVLPSSSSSSSPLSTTAITTTPHPLTTASGPAVTTVGSSDHSRQDTSISAQVEGKPTEGEEVKGVKKKADKLEGVEEMEMSPVRSDATSGELEFTHTKSSSDSVSGFGSGSGSASEREGSPPLHERSPPSSKVSSGSPEGKRKWRPHDEESREEYERRKRARHAEMNYTLDFSKLPPMTSVERISMIQERLKEVQGRWSDLKAEVAYIERKRRRVKRREREAAHAYASNTQVPSNATPPSHPPTDSTPPCQPQLNNSAITCR